MAENRLISPEDVEYIAHLARISLKEEELDRLTKDLEGILHYINKLEKIDLSRIEPTSHVLALKNIYRQDEIKPSLPQAKALKTAASVSRGSFQVPRVIE
jgi:aspartyl-tRNA(Asn)/glutamyl-tRNA(Gln) amidotransferase subunit C